MNRNYKIALVLLIVASILFTEGVSAEMISKQVCVSNILYYVKWDSTVSTEVTLDKIDEKAIETGNVIHHFITTETVDITKYEFKSVSTAQKCETAQNGDIITCPGDSGLGDIDIRHFLDTTESDEKIVTGITGTEKIYENKLVYKNIDMQINEITGLVYVKIKDIFNGAIKLRNVMNVKENKNEYANKKATDYPEGEFLTLSNGYYHVGYVSPEDIVSLEAYLTGNTKTGKCQNIYLGNVGFKMPVAGEFDITNPTIANPKAYNCNLVHENKNMPTNFKEMAFPECYKSKRPTITLAEKAGLADLIYKRYEKLADLFEKYSLKDPNDPISSTLNDADFSCTAGKQTGRLNNSYSSAGSYWALDCYEEYEIVPASPKLVSAGDGFHYGVDVVIRRYCDLTQTGMVQKKEVVDTNVIYLMGLILGVILVELVLIMILMIVY